MPTYLYQCFECGDTTDGFFSLKEVRPEKIPCKSCDAQAEYQIHGPQIIHRKSFVDGQKRKGWKDLREASKLNRLAAGEDDQKKKEEILKEGKKIGYNFVKEGS